MSTGIDDSMVLRFYRQQRFVIVAWLIMTVIPMAVAAVVVHAVLAGRGFIVIMQFPPLSIVFSGFALLLLAADLTVSTSLERKSIQKLARGEIPFPQIPRATLPHSDIESLLIVASCLRLYGAMLAGAAAVVCTGAYVCEAQPWMLIFWMVCIVAVALHIPAYERLKTWLITAREKLDNLRHGQQ